MNTSEHIRMAESQQGTPNWRRFGPYLSERQWGTVREDYSPHGSAWDYFPHDHARSRAYRWGEDGIGGFSDDQQLLCMSLAIWNTRDPILKERLFGLTGPEGNHGEDVKELYFFLDATPSHSFMRMLYKYPHAAFPYDRLVDENASRDKSDPEFELIDTGVFDDQRYFDVFIEYAKGAPEDVLMRVRVCNRGPEDAEVVIAPQVWFRNTWDWDPSAERPVLRDLGSKSLEANHINLGKFIVNFDEPDRLAFCENETNERRLYGSLEAEGYFKDGLDELIVHGNEESVNPAGTGTKAAGVWRRTIPAGGEFVLRVRLTRDNLSNAFEDFDEIFAQREQEADLFWNAIHGSVLDEDQRRVQRQALAGMLWSKQFYYYDVRKWLAGDPGQPTPPPERLNGRNHEWGHLNNADILSMPDTWEYPWYAAWDLAFHCVPLALVDADFAKEQLLLLTREPYMHPNGQLPAYEWAFGDVNPPVHAWAAWRVFEMDRDQKGGDGDLDFLERILHKLLLNFTWWVNRKDEHGLNVFQGGFLGLDNVGVFDRSGDLPVAGHIDQADGTAWMAMYAVNLMRISLELALHRPAYEDIATKFFEHFLHIAEAMGNVGGHGVSLWDEQDGFFYDVLHYDCAEENACESMQFKIRSLVGLIPLFAVDTLDSELLERLPGFKARMTWFLEHRPDLASLISRWEEPGTGSTRLLSLLRGHRMKLLLKRMLDETEFLSDFGVRSLSKSHLGHPYTLEIGGLTHTVSYEPGESSASLFGGNSNWRGPIWMPVNYLLIESLRKFHKYYGDEFRVECPTGSGQFLSLSEVADELSNRLSRLFLAGGDGHRPSLGAHFMFQTDPHFRDLCLFHEHFHGDNGRGVGASHQTGWTGMIASLLAEQRPPHSATPAKEPAGSKRKGKIR